MRRGPNVAPDRCLLRSFGSFSGLRPCFLPQKDAKEQGGTVFRPLLSMFGSEQLAVSQIAGH